MDVAIDKAMDQIVRGRLTEYEQERPSLLSTLKRHARPIAREYGPMAMITLGGSVAYVGLPFSLMAGMLGNGTLAALFASAGLTGLAAMKFPDAPFARLTPNQQEWADDMRKLRGLMIGAEIAGEKTFDTQQLRELSKMGWIQRALSPVPKEVFKVADQMRKIEGTTYEGVQPDPAQRSPIQMLVDARDRRWDAQRDNWAAIKKAAMISSEDGPASRSPSP